MSKNNSNDIIGNRNRDIPVYRAVHQSIAAPLAPVCTVGGNLA